MILLDRRCSLSFCRKHIQLIESSGLQAEPSSSEQDGSVSLDDLDREVYGILGIPIDAVGLEEVVRRIGSALRSDEPYLISTPNLNFLVTAQTDAAFRESLLMSDLCPVDGVPIVWISRLMGIPIKGRVAGSDIFDRLKSGPQGSVKVFLFGGPQGVAETAGRVLNGQSSAVSCVGSLFPGFGSVEEMSSDEIIEAVNASGARFLVASLGAQKGQSWLRTNHHRLRIPVRSHLGAAINFQAGLLKRAPLIVRKSGFEWLWRIKEEPYLWRRYLHDGSVLLRLMLSRALPLALAPMLRRFGAKEQRRLSVSMCPTSDRAPTILLAGDGVAETVGEAVPSLREGIRQATELTIDLAQLKSIDARFLGLLLMVRKSILQKGGRLVFANSSRRIQRAVRLHGFGFLLDSDAHHAVAKTRVLRREDDEQVASPANFQVSR
ncbi:WecB/TagA/CpsF family glycosyltransferase [Bradyrhizobium sp. STM 3809]|uniref:WecB/TagA/CpsF family glycosyltransferase n=1 Tax=Bradyrhizobium sp. STM 3809 TaxID=551936 RepID=UPI001F0AC6D7|nr:WecB/TagA/CpsF family glycosyltransferase [Bradyrhizobium sp. STM 3809]